MWRRGGARCGGEQLAARRSSICTPPYGRDFDTHRPTGRFSNGRIPVDYLAEKLGLPFVSPYLEQSMRMGVGSVGLSNIGGMIQGVNYASAAADILSSSGSELGMHVSLTQQVQQLGEAATVDVFKRSIFFVFIGMQCGRKSSLLQGSNVLM